MPSVRFTSLKTENDSLKGEIATLRRGFEYLQKSLTRNDAQESGNGGEPSCSTRKMKYWILFSSVEKLTMTSPCKLIRVFNNCGQFQKLHVTSRMYEVGNAIDEIQRYNSQYNVKIVGLPEIDSRESASATMSLFISLLKATRVDINRQDIVIAHRCAPCPN